VSRVAQPVQCLATGWTTGRSGFDTERRKDFSCSLCVQTGSEAHPAFCTKGTWGPFPGAKARPEHDADHSTPSSAEVENERELCLLSPQAPSWSVVGQLLKAPCHYCGLSFTYIIRSEESVCHFFIIIRTLGISLLFTSEKYQRAIYRVIQKSRNP
jgi:hypothetical protein